MGSLAQSARLAPACAFGRRCLKDDVTTKKWLSQLLYNIGSPDAAAPVVPPQLTSGEFQGQ